MLSNTTDRLGGQMKYFVISGVPKVLIRLLKGVSMKAQYFKVQ